MRAIRAEDRDRIAAFLVERWYDRVVMLDGRAIDAASLPGFVELGDGGILGLVTLLDGVSESEIVTLDAVNAFTGLGTRLVEKAAERAADLRLSRLVVRTTNDNLDALRFYQRRGFRLHRLVPGAIDEERRTKPSIPLIGRYGIPVRDELTLVRDVG
ncbi:GNAT family N-acetyltransferase [Rhodospirillaceae bacterium SYSU D60014]|uniref:GNAT family N-acetyltransferase n=1 Tax=Virgifigura deserti TaxID=2268457 RepID=UPI000E66A384